MPEQPYPPRYALEDTGDRLRITIPSRKNWFVTLFTGLFLIVWAAGFRLWCKDGPFWQRRRGS